MSMRLHLEPLTVTIGSEVHGVDLSRPIDDELGLEIHDALVDRGMLVFRGQDPSPESHVRLAACLGELGPPHPLYPSVEGFAEISRIVNDERHPPESEVWHSDLTCRADPPFASVLRGALIPPVGGDTLWADMRAAHDAMPEQLRVRVSGLRARHSLAHGFRFLGGFGQTDRQDSLDRQSADTVTEHPVVIRHPLSGRRVLFVNESFSESIVGMDDVESESLLEELLAYARHPRFQVRMRWEPGTVVMWDNWSTQHFACGDHYPTWNREVQRITLATSRRFGRFSASGQ